MIDAFCPFLALRSRTRFVCLAGVSLFALAVSGHASLVDVTAPTTSWTVIRYSGGPSSDPSTDQQTGVSEGDIVGNALHPSVYTMFGDANTPLKTDGNLAFRIRVGADSGPPGFAYAAFIGIITNPASGKIDLFLGVNNSGATNYVGIWLPGTGSNTSPSTTTIGNTPLVSYSEVASNYNWSPVTTTIDPSVGTATDINADGNVDYFVTFSIPFADIVAQLAAKGITGINEDSLFSYVIATSTQGNSLNMDLNGVTGGVNSASTWASLGALTDPTSPVSSVPEVNGGALIAIAAALLVGARWWKKSRLAAALQRVG